MKSKPIIACIGNCQSTVVSAFLQSLPELSRTHEFQVVPVGNEDVANSGSKYAAALDYLQKHRDRIRMVVNQESHEWSRHPIQKSDVPANCVYVSYPAAIVNYVWPLIPSYRRPKGVRGPEFALFPYTVCDDRVIRPLDAFRVDRLREINLAKLRAIDAKSDFAIAPVIERDFQSVQLFSTANHPNGPMMAHLLQGIVDRASSIITDPEMAEYRIAQRRTGKGVQDVEAPVHPEIAAHFGLEWASEKRFRFWDEGSFTFDHWLLRLYDYSYCQPHQQAMERLRKGDYEGAEPLLRQALAELPESIAIRQTLAGLLARRGAVDELVEQWAHIYRQAPTGGNLDAYYGALSRRGRAEARAFIEKLDVIPDEAVAVRLAFFADADPKMRRKAGTRESLMPVAATHPRYWTVEAERARRAGDSRLEAEHLARAYYVSNWSAQVAAQIEKRFGLAPKAEPMNLDFSAEAVAPVDDPAPTVAVPSSAEEPEDSNMDKNDPHHALRTRVEKAELDARLAEAKARLAEANTRLLQAELAGREAQAELDRQDAPAAKKPAKP